MGAYENPRFFNAPNYVAGTQAFIGTFKKGLEEGLQMGEDLIADRKEYEKGIFEKGDELKHELDAAVANSQMTKEQVQGALRSFYDEALKVDKPTKKGLGGLFAKAEERRLGDLDLVEAQNSFTDAVTGINTAFNYTYDPEVDIMENEDRGHELYKKKRALYEAIKSGKANTSFSYTKDGGFDSNIKVMIDGKEEEFSTAEIQTIFTASGKEQRDLIDKKHNETIDGLYKRVEAATTNRFEAIKLGDENALVKMETDADKITDQVLGLRRDDNGKILFNKKNIEFINDEYNNHADISLENKINIFKNNPAFANLKDEEILNIIDEPMTMGVETYKKRFGMKEEDARKFYDNVLNSKAEIVKQSYMEELRDRGLIDKGYKAPAKQQITDGARDAFNLNVYARDRANELSDAASDIVSNFKRVKSDMPSDAPRNYLKMPNPEYDEDLANEEGYNVPAEIEVLKLDDTFAQSFQGKTMKLKDGKIRNIDNVYVDLDGNIKFDFKEGEISGTDEEGKFKEDLLEETADFNIYNPKSMESLYMAAGAELSGEKSKVQYRNQYKVQISNAYLNNPEQFEDPQMSGWVNYIYSNLGPEQMLKNERFKSWLKKTNSKDMNPLLQKLRQSVLP